MLDTGKDRISMKQADFEELCQRWFEMGRLQERIEATGRKIDEFRAEQEAERQLRERYRR